MYEYNQGTSEITVPTDSVDTDVWQTAPIFPRGILQHFQDKAVDDAAAVGGRKCSGVKNLWSPICFFKKKKRRKKGNFFPVYEK